MPGALDELDLSIDQMLSTLRERVEQVEAERAELRADYLNRDAALKASITKAKRLISANEKFGTRTKPKPKTPSDARRLGITPQKVDDLARYLQANFNGDEFHAPMLLERADLLKETGIASKGQLGKALHSLHDRGALRLVRQGGIEGLGNRTQVWKVTDAQ